MATGRKTAGNTAMASSDSQNEAIKEADKENTTEKVKVAEKGKYGAVKETFIYIGPTVRAGELKENAMLTGTREEIREYLKEILEAIPQVERLLVPLRNLAEGKNRVGQKGTLLNKFYNEVVSLDYAKKED